VQELGYLARVENIVASELGAIWNQSSRAHRLAAETQRDLPVLTPSRPTRPPIDFQTVEDQRSARVGGDHVMLPGSDHGNSPGLPRALGQAAAERTVHQSALSDTRQVYGPVPMGTRQLPRAHAPRGARLRAPAGRTRRGHAGNHCTFDPRARHRHRRDHPAHPRRTPPSTPARERAELDELRALLKAPATWVQPDAGLEDRVVDAITEEAQHDPRVCV
jgi:hypothetical protein